MILHLLFITLIGGPAQAAIPLKEKARQEKTWKPIEIRATEDDAVILATGFLTPEKSWRLNQINPEIEIKTALTSPLASSYGVKSFDRLCRRMKFGFASVRELNRSHQIEIALPKWQGISPSLDGPQEVRLLKVQSHLVFSSEANTLLYGQIDPRLIEKQVENQIQSQLESLRLNGTAKIKIDGHDYLACDFVTGLAQLTFDVTWEYPSARLKRQSLLLANEIRAVVDEAKSKYFSYQSCEINGAMASSLLTASLKAKVDRKLADLDQDTFIRFLLGVYDLKNCEWRSQAAISWDELQQEFDLLSEEVVRQQTKVINLFSGELK